MDGRAEAPAAGTVLNALATGTGAAFAIDESVTAEVRLDDREGVDGSVAGAPGADTALIEQCVSLVTERFGAGEGGEVRTDGDVPMASGLKSSSAAANAAVLATLAALGVDVATGDREVDAPDRAEADGPNRAEDDGDARIDREEAARLGVRAAREVGVTVTGAFDDASASMLGGVTLTDNETDELLARDSFERAAVVWTPPERAYSADADVERCRRVAPMADTVADLALEGAYGRAMTVNGFAFCAALEFPTEPLVEALPAADGVSLSGTGPSYVAVGEREALEPVEAAWRERPGRTWTTTTRNQGARLS